MNARNICKSMVPFCYCVSCIVLLFQEPGTNEEIKKFATEKYGVQFDMFAKIDVNKDSAHPLWKYLKDKQGGTLGR